MQADCVWEQGAEKNNWVYVWVSNISMEKTTWGGAK